MQKLFVSINSEKITKNIWIYFAAIIIFNILLKVIDLGYSSFWYDEIISVESAWLDFGHIKHVSEWDNNPPFYYYCLSIWIKLFNDSEFFVRFLSVIFSSLSGGVIFLIANKFFNKTTSIIASLLYLSSGFLYFYSHEARAYALVGLLVLISSYLFINFKEKNSWKYILFLGLINFLIVYTHYIAALAIGLQLVCMLIYFERKEKIYYSFSILITILLIALRFTKKQFLLIFAFNNPESKFWLKKSEFSYLKSLTAEFFFSSYLIIPLLIVIILGLIIVFKNKQKQSKFPFMYCLVIGIGSIIVLYFVGMKVSVFLDRYIIFALPFIYILIAYVFSFIKNQLFTILPVILFFIFSFSKIDYKTPKPMDYKNAVIFIKQIKTKDDFIIVKPDAVPSLFCYYYEEGSLKLQKKKLTNEPNILISESWSDIKVDFEKYKRVIVIDAFETGNLQYNEFESNLFKAKKNKAVVKMFKGIKITFYK